MTYRILDFFCGAGGAAMGYHRAGFEVSGVDIVAQQRYPFEFNQCDALELMRDMISTRLLERARIAAIHASPPCQRYSVTRSINSRLDEYPDLIEPVRDLLQQTGLPYIIENVPGAPLRDPVMLCGSMFDLRAYWPEPQQQRWVELRRHRLFETNWPLVTSRRCEHLYPAIPVAGHGVPGNRADPKGPGRARVCREVMRIDWMSRRELNEAIPPAYSEYVGHQLRVHLNRTSNHEAA